MTRLEQLEQQKAEIEAKRKEVSKALAVEKRKLAAKAEAERRIKEQAEAIEFLAECKKLRVSDKADAPTIYDWVMHRINKAAKDAV